MFGGRIWGSRWDFLDLVRKPSASSMSWASWDEHGFLPWDAPRGTAKNSSPGAPTVLKVPQEKLLIPFLPSSLLHQHSATLFPHPQREIFWDREKESAAGTSQLMGADSRAQASWTLQRGTSYNPGAFPKGLLQPMSPTGFLHK